MAHGCTQRLIGWYLHRRVKVDCVMPMVYSITVFVLSECGWKNLVGIWQPSFKHGIKFKIWRLNISSLNLTKRTNAIHSKQVQRGLESVSHLQKITDNITVLSKQISSPRNRWPPWKMFMPLDKQQKHILTIFSILKYRYNIPLVAGAEIQLFSIQAPLGFGLLLHRTSH